MNYLFIDQQTGLIRYSAIDTEYTDIITPDDLLIIPMEDKQIALSIHLYYYKETVKLLPTKPDNYHIWDLETETWVVNQQNLLLAFNGIIKNIKSLRDSKDDQDITYDSVSYQVAVKDRENITGKIAVLKAEIELSLPEDTSTYFWRDSNNNIRFWSNRTDYLAWLQGLTIAYGNRRSSIYVRSWQHGAAIKAIMDDINLTNEQKLNSLLSYDITTGW